jgi:hypothetical membrane protein
MSAQPPEPEVPSVAPSVFLTVAALVVLYAVLDVVAQSLPPHYSPISQAESDLAVGPYGYVMTINFVVRGLLSLLFLGALARALRASGSRWTDLGAGFALTAAWGVGAFLLAAFPTDVPATPVSWHGEIHLVVAAIAFLAGAFGVLLLALRFSEHRVLAAEADWAIPLGVLAVLLCFVELGLPFVAPHLAARVGGVTERLFLGSVLLWILLASLRLARRSGPAPAAGGTVQIPPTRSG